MKMKNFLLRSIVLSLIFGIFAVLPVSAQKKQADVYYFNVPILKVFVHNKGYYVIYRRGNLEAKEAFIPYKWFLPSDGRAILQTTNDRINPYLSVYVKEGKFDFTKLVIPKDLKHSVWGILKVPSDYDNKFDHEGLELKF